MESDSSDVFRNIIMEPESDEKIVLNGKEVVVKREYSATLDASQMETVNGLTSGGEVSEGDKYSGDESDASVESSSSLGSKNKAYHATDGKPKRTTAELLEKSKKKRQGIKAKVASRESLPELVEQAGLKVVEKVSKFVSATTEELKETMRDGKRSDKSAKVVGDLRTLEISEQNFALRQELEEVSAERDKARDDLEALLAEIKRSSTDYEAIIKDKKAMIVSYEKENSALKEKCLILEKERDGMCVLLDESKMKIESLKTTFGLQEERFAEVKSQMDVTISDCEKEIEELRDELVKAKEENQTLQTDGASLDIKLKESNAKLRASEEKLAVAKDICEKCKENESIFSKFQKEIDEKHEALLREMATSQALEDELRAHVFTDEETRKQREVSKDEEGLGSEASVSTVISKSAYEKMTHTSRFIDPLLATQVSTIYGLRVMCRSLGLKAPDDLEIRYEEFRWWFLTSSLQEKRLLLSPILPEA